MNKKTLQAALHYAKVMHSLCKGDDTATVARRAELSNEIAQLQADLKAVSL